MTLDEEKTKSLYEHKLSVKRIIIEKGFLALIIIIAGIVGNMLIESYKSENIKKRFNYETKWFASNEIRSSYSDITTLYYALSQKSCDQEVITTGDVETLKEYIRNTIDKIKQYSISIDLENQKQLGLVLNILAGLTGGENDDYCKCRYFVSDISDYFTVLLKQNAGIESSQWSGFKPIEMSMKRMDEINSYSYFAQNYTLWKKR